jgi:putative Mg2+ transporter-C (MgtC) family protein
METLIWTDLELLARVGLAMFLAAFIGWERERRDHPAGLRTHILVAAAAATATSMWDAIVVASVERFEQPVLEMIEVDPIRGMQAVLMGIGFLGAGNIVVHRHHYRVRGLTTAASIFATAAIGCAAGLQRHVLATGTTVLLLLVLWPLQKLDEKASRRGFVEADDAARSQGTKPR